MARWRVYIKPFDELGVYLDDYIEVTKDVAALGDPQQKIDGGEFDVGLVKNSGFNIQLRNDHGRYSDVTNTRSIFRTTRKNSLVKITWDVRDYDLIAGFFQCGREPLGGEYLVFTGVLNEVTSQADINSQMATFAVLGFDSLLNEIEVPFASISNGNLLSTILLAMLNQAPFNELVTVSGANISLGTDLAIDDKSQLENKTVGASLKNILLAANSVLYLKNDTVYVVPRDVGATLIKTFYGQASENGIENIIDIPKFRDGLNRTFNLWTWTDVPAVDSRDITSIETYGIRAKEMRVELFDDGSVSKIQTILDANKDEFANPKIELELETPNWYDVLAINILDKVNIDYPTVYIPYDGGVLPRYDMEAIYDGTMRYPFGVWSLTLETTTFFKVISKRINVKKQTVTFGLREV